MLADQSPRMSELGDPSVRNLMIAAWKQAAFSVWPEPALQRYFHHQLCRLVELRPEDEVARASQLLLVRELLYFLPEAARGDLPAPDSYREWLVEQLSVPLERLKAVLEPQPASAPLRNLIGGISSPTIEKQYTFRSLHYIKLLVEELAVVEPNAIFEKLVQLNFNDLIYWNIVLDGWRESLAGFNDAESRQTYLMLEKGRILCLPEIGFYACHPDWPSLKTMLTGWLNEQLACEIPPAVKLVKIGLNISVAQLACWLRLAYEEGIFKEISLTTLFQFFAGHFEAKKQQVISAGSLSKEYYSAGQKPAAIMRDNLLKMVARLNRYFFPVLVVINVLGLFA